jgi:hypothetical protein
LDAGIKAICFLDSIFQECFPSKKTKPLLLYEHLFPVWILLSLRSIWRICLLFGLNGTNKPHLTLKVSLVYQFPRINWLYFLAARSNDLLCKRFNRRLKKEF